MLVECGHVQAQTSDGSEWSFTPSLERIAGLGTPREIVALYADLHGPRAPQCAAYVLACLCDQEDPSKLIGWHEADPDAKPDKPRLRWVQGLMPEAEQVVIARHLMQHGIVGKAKPGGEAKSQAGQFAAEFDASEYVLAARAHLGLSAADAGALSMTELQRLLEMKFPDAAKRERDVPTREEYDAAMRAFEESRA